MSSLAELQSQPKRANARAAWWRAKEREKRRQEKLADAARHGVISWHAPPVEEPPPAPARTCQWIVAPPASFGTMPTFCDQPATRRAYCAKHADRVFAPRPAR
jgi:hypothetical protein